MKSQDDISEKRLEPAKLFSTTELIFLFIGSFGLAFAVLTDTIAVIGRHLNIALLGSIEIVQASIVLLASGAIVAATKHGNHARVRILTDRLNPALSARLNYFTALISTIYSLLMAVGCAWVIWEVWTEHERSEILHIPLAWLRLLLLVALVSVSAYFLCSRFGVSKK
jgi:TRAP-type C4-dicarboxylate transport system permease small subunit